MGSARPGSNPGDCEACDPRPNDGRSMLHAVMSERLRSQTRMSRVSVETTTDRNACRIEVRRFLFADWESAPLRGGTTTPSTEIGAVCRAGDEEIETLALFTSATSHRRRTRKQQIGPQAMVASRSSPRTSLFKSGGSVLSRASGIACSITRRPTGSPFAPPLLLLG